MSIPTPKNAPIKRRLSPAEVDAVKANVLDAEVADSMPVEKMVHPENSLKSFTNLGRGDHQIREHLMQRPFAKDPAFAELARQTREASGALEAMGFKSIN